MKGGGVQKPVACMGAVTRCHPTLDLKVGKINHGLGKQAREWTKRFKSGQFFLEVSILFIFMWKMAVRHDRTGSAEGAKAGAGTLVPDRDELMGQTRTRQRKSRRKGPAISGRRGRPADPL